MSSDEWRCCDLGEALTLQRGFDLPHKSRRDGTIPVVSSSGISGFHDRAQVSAPGVVTGRYGTIGEVFYLTEDFWPLNTTLYVRDFRNNDPLYIAYLLQTVDFATHSGKSGVPGVNRKDIHKLTIRIPCSAEQRAIAEALSDVDGLLGALEALIAKKRAIKKAAMQQLLTGKTRLPGFSGEWETRQLGRHVTFLRHGTHPRADLISEGPLRYLHYGDIHTSTRVYLDPRVTPMPCLPVNRGENLDRLKDGDLVLVDASEDVEGLAKSVEMTNTGDCEVVSGLHTIAARFEKSVLADGFKAYLQFSPTFREHLRRLAAGTKVYATNRAHIASVEMALPETREQNAIATVLSDMDAEIAALEARREKTRAIKQGMMQQLLTGRVRLVKPKAAP